MVSLTESNKEMNGGKMKWGFKNAIKSVQRKLARRGSIYLIDDKQQTISGAIYNADPVREEEFNPPTAETMLAEINLADVQLLDINMLMDTMPNVNKTLCSGTKLYDNGFDLHFVHPGKPMHQVPEGFTGAFNPKTGASIPVFKEGNGFWYIYYVMAHDQGEGAKEIAKGNVHRMLLDTGANYNLGDAKHVPFMKNKVNSRLSARGAFGPAIVHGDKRGDLQLWVLEYPPDKAVGYDKYKRVTAHAVDSDDLHHTLTKGESIDEPVCANLTLADYMQDQIYKDQTSEIIGSKNQLGGAYKRMDSLEYHCRMGHRGYFPGCRICQAVARSLKRTYVDRVLFKEIRSLFSFTMDAVVFSSRSRRGRKYGYIFICMGPSGYQEGFTLVNRSDLCSVFFPMVERLRERFAGCQPHEIFKELLVDAAGEHISEEFKDKCVELGIVHKLPSTRKQSMGLAEITMKKSEINMKTMMLEVNALVQDWEDHYLNHIFLENRLPKMKDVKSSDGDAPTPLETASGGRFSRRLCYKELKSFVTAGKLCDVKTPDVKGSNIDKCARSRLCVALRAQSGGVTRFMDVKTKAHFRSNDFTIIDLQGACCSWQEYLKMDVKGTRASMPHAGDSILIQGMRQINVAEIGSDTREHRELSELTFEAELEEQAATKAEKLQAEETAVQQQKLVQGMDTDGQFSQGVKSKMPSSLAAIPKSSGADSVETIVSDPCDLPVLKAISVGQQRDLLLLSEDPDSFINRKVVQHWPGYGCAEGLVYDRSDDGQGNTLWGIQWGDGLKTDFDTNQMRKYCVLMSDGAADSTWMEDYVSDIAAVRRRLTKLKLVIYETKDGDTWSKICFNVGMKSNTAKNAYYMWLRKFHGYGSVKHSDEEIPWMKFSDPYSCVRPRRTTKFQKRVPFPHPSGPEWEELIAPEATIGGHHAESVQANQIISAQFAEVEFEQQTRRRLDKLYEIIDAKRSAVEHDVKVQYVNELTSSGSTKESHQYKRSNPNHASHRQTVEAIIMQVSDVSVAEFAEALSMNAEWRAETDVFTAAVVKEMSVKKDFTDEQLNAFARMPPPKNYEEAMRREDAPLWEAAVRTELAAFDKYDIMEHQVSRKEIRERGIRGRPIPLKMLFEVKRNDDGTYAKHKVRCILMGHSGFLVSGVHYQETYAPSPDNFSNIFVSALGLTRDWKIVQFDVTTAYLQSAQQHNECANLILEYPKGWGGVDEEGERYLALLKSPVYGHPTAARSWSKTVTEWINEFFGSKGWDVGVMHSEPCLFVLLSPDDSVKILIVYVDDCRIQGEREEDLEYIKQSFGQRFGIKDVDPRYFLGCLMEIEDQGEYKTLTITQPDFVEDLLIKYAEFMPAETKYSVPFEPGTVLGINEPDYNPSLEEQEKYRAMGALSLAGQLLWVARRAYNVLLFAVTQLCAVMSKPSEKMWKAGIRILIWLRDHYKEGSRFYSNGSTVPFFHYDAGHNQYASDSKAHHGHVAVFAGGPVGNESKKHEDLGDSTPYNVALYWFGSALQKYTYESPLVPGFEMPEAPCMGAPIERLKRPRRPLPV